MLILTKSILSIMVGFIIAVILGLLLIPVLKRINFGQRISEYVGESHRKKEGTPTMGGLIFIVRLIDDLVVFIVDGRTANIQKVVFQINAAPFQTHDFRAPEGVKTEKGGDFARCTFDCGKKRLDT